MEKIYYDPKTGYTGIEPLVKQAKCRRKNVIDWLEMQPTYTLHKPARKKYPRNKVIVSRIDEVDLQSLSKYNDGYKYLLNCIDVFSKYAWSVPTKNKTGKSVTGALQNILSKGRMPEKVQSDAGKEFLNVNFQQMLKHNNIDFFSTNSELKACVVERFNRTLKERMWRYFTKNNTYRYIDVLQDLVIGYNNTKHRTIDIEPINVNMTNESQILATVYKLDTTPGIFKYNVGDKVRISKVKRLFEKGYEPNWSEETFVIDERLNRKPVVYRVKDQMGEKLGGVFYEQELQKVNVPDEVYIIDKVLKTKTVNGKTEYFVKWRGYPDKFNNWVKGLIKL